MLFFSLFQKCSKYFLKNVYAFFGIVAKSVTEILLIESYVWTRTVYNFCWLQCFVINIWYFYEDSQLGNPHLFNIYLFCTYILLLIHIILVVFNIYTYVYTYIYIHIYIHIYINIKWSYCETKNGRCAENVGHVEIAFSVLSTLKKLSKKRKILKWREEDAISSGYDFLRISRVFSRDRVLNYVEYNLSIYGFFYFYTDSKLIVGTNDTERKKAQIIFPAMKYSVYIHTRMSVYQIILYATI